MHKGIIYIALCDEKPGVVKVGFTTKETWERERGFAGATSLEEWKIKAVFETPDCKYSEKLAHARLETLGPGVRLRDRRELFAANFATTLAICAEAAAHTVAAPVKTVKQEKAMAVTHSNPLWQDVLKVKFVGSQTLATLITEANRGQNAAISKLRRLGLACVRFDFKTPLFALDTEVESRLSDWLAVRGHAVENLLDKKGNNTVSFNLAAV